MKKSLFTAFAVGLALTTNLWAQVPSYMPTNGLVAWYPFNSNAKDESGNGHHGNDFGLTLSTDRFGNSGNSFRFNGASSYIDIPSSVAFQTQYFTISFWIKYTSNTQGSQNPSIISMLPSSGNVYDNYVFYENSGFLTGACGFNGTSASGSTGTNPLNDNNWKHIVLSVNSDSSRFYLNGSLSSIQSKGVGINFKNYPIRIGKSLHSYWSGFVGGIDDVCFFNRALTQQEITALYKSCSNPTATITPQSSTTFCQGGSVKLTATAGNNYSYEWYKDGQQINGAATSDYQAATSGNYTVKVIDGACNATSLVTTVTVNPLPTITGGTSVCEKATVQLTGNGTAATSSPWTSSNVAVATVSNSGLITGVKAGTTTISYKNSNGCSSTSTIVVNSPVTPTFTQVSAICSGANLTALPTTSSNSINGTWAPSLNNTATTTYTFTPSSDQCANTATMSITVNPLPTITGGTSVCEKATVQLTGNGTAAISSPWTSSNVAVATVSNSGLITGVKAGTTTISYKNSNGCSSTSTITVNPLPTASITANGSTTFCQGNSVVLNANTGNGLTYQWKNNNVNITGATTASYTSNTSGSYTVVVTNSSNCVTTSNAITVTVNPLPNVTLSGLNNITNYHAAPQTLIGNPPGGTYVGAGVTNNSFNPSKAGLGMKSIAYSYSDNSGCTGKKSLNTMVFDTLGIVCTTFDTLTTNVYDTVLTTVTDTLIINTTLSLPAPNNENTILIYPNPASDHITIDNGNFAAMAGYSIKITNNAGQQVFQSAINQAQFYVDLSTWSGNGLYFVHLIDPKNKTVTVRKIVLQ